jgi:hypothetical protein
MKHNREATAYHEAGHAVVAWWLGHKPKRVTIVPGDGYEGVTFQTSPFRRMSPDVSPEWTDPESPDGIRMMRRIDHKILMTLAGPTAQKKYNPRSKVWVGATGCARRGEPFSHGSDYQQVIDLISRVYGTGKVADAYWDYMQARAEVLVEKLWPNIQLLAAALLERETLRGAEIGAAIRQT